jgi:hypothetical protein
MLTTETRDDRCRLQHAAALQPASATLCIVKSRRHRWGPVTNSQVFDHVLRSGENYSKWDYVRENPVRAGLTSDADDWPWQGEIELLML